MSQAPMDDGTFPLSWQYGPRPRPAPPSFRLLLAFPLSSAPHRAPFAAFFFSFFFYFFVFHHNQYHHLRHSEGFTVSDRVHNLPIMSTVVLSAPNNLSASPPTATYTSASFVPSPSKPTSSSTLNGKLSSKANTTGGSSLSPSQRTPVESNASSALYVHVDP